MALPDLSDVSYLYAETLWPDFGEEQHSLAAVDRFASDLMASEDRGLGSVIKDDRGRVLTPSWLDAVSFDADPSRERVFCAGSMTHAALGRHAALDLGARNSPLPGRMRRARGRR